MNPHESSELNENVDVETVNKVVERISSSWPEVTHPSKPIVVMIGGFQGSGKTSTAETIKEEFGLTLISPDEIRHELFALNYPFSEKFVSAVAAIGRKLVKNAVDEGRSVIIDQNTTKQRIEAIRELLEKHGNSRYQLITILLDASEKTLIDRVKNRPQLPGKYKGTVEELRATMQKQGRHDYSLYDFVLNTDEMSTAEVTQKIRDKIKEATS